MATGDEVGGTTMTEFIPIKDLEAEFNSVATKFRNELQKAHERCSKQQDEIIKLKKELKQAEQRHSREQHYLQNMNEENKSHIERLNEHIKSMNIKIKELNSEHSKETEQLKFELNEVNHSLTSKINEEKIRTTEMEYKICTLKEECAKHSETEKNLNAEVERLTSEKEQLHSRLQSSIETLEEQVKTLKEQKENLCKEKQELKEQNETLTKVKKIPIEQNETLREKNKVLTDENTCLTSDIERLTDENTCLTSDIERLKCFEDIYPKLNEENKMNKREIERMRPYEETYPFLQIELRNLEEILKHKLAIIQDLKKENSSLAQEKQSLLLRLSKLAGVNLTYNNPNIADLSDDKRPTKLAEEFSELYDNEWTDAFEDVDITDEEQKTAFMLGLLQRANLLCRDVSTKHNEDIQRSLSTLTVSMSSQTPAEQKNQSIRGETSQAIIQICQDKTEGDEQLNDKGILKSKTEDSHKGKTDETIYVGKDEVKEGNQDKTSKKATDGTLKGENDGISEGKKQETTEDESEGKINNLEDEPSVSNTVYCVNVFEKEGIFQGKICGTQGEGSSASEGVNYDVPGRKKVEIVKDGKFKVEKDEINEQTSGIFSSRKDEKNKSEKDNTVEGETDESSEDGKYEIIKDTDNRRTTAKQDKTADNEKNGTGGCSNTEGTPEGDGAKSSYEQKIIEGGENDGFTEKDRSNGNETYDKRGQTSKIKQEKNITCSDENPEVRSNLASRDDDDAVLTSDENEMTGSFEGENKGYEKPKPEEINDETGKYESKGIVVDEKPKAPRKDQVGTTDYKDEITRSKEDTVESDLYANQESCSRLETTGLTSESDSTKTVQKLDVAVQTLEEENQTGEPDNTKTTILESDFNKLQKEQMKIIMDARKFFEVSLTEEMVQAGTDIIVQEIGIDALKQESVVAYIKKCIDICWSMNRHDQPVYVDIIDVTESTKFDTNKFKPYTKSGKYIDYIVWPALHLHEGGPLLCKGVAQGRKE